MLASFFVILGALISGQAGINTLKDLTSFDLSQAVIGCGIIKGTSTVNIHTLKNILLAWFLTPIIACLIAIFITFGSYLEYTGK